MPSTADRAARASWTRAQAGHTVTAQPGYGSTITTTAGSTSAPPASLDALCTLADERNELI